MRPDYMRPFTGRAHIRFERGWWRMYLPNGDVHAAPTIGALAAYARHPWTRGWVA